MVLGEVVGFVGGPWLPLVAELRLRRAAVEPVQSHVHRFQPFARDVVGDYAECCGVVRLHWCWGLLVTHFFQRMPCRYGFTAIYEEGAEFSFCH